MLSPFGGGAAGGGIGRMRKGYPRPAVCQTLLAAVAVLFLAGCGADAENVRNQALASQQLAYAFMNEGRPARALQELTKAESLLPDDPEIKNFLGLAYWKQGEFASAERKFRDAVELKADYSEAWNNLGAFYIDQGRYFDAVAALEKALANVFYDTREYALANIGWALMKLGRTDEARKRLETAVDVAPGYPHGHRNLGILWQELGEHQKAIERFDKTIKLYPDDPETHLRRGLSLLKLGQRLEARKSFEQAWKLGPSSEPGKSAKTYLDLMQ